MLLVKPFFMEPLSLKTGDPIGGASIRVEGTTRGTYTRGNGTFRLPLPENAKSILVRSIGYKQTRRTLDGGVSISIKLDPASVNYESVKVTGDIEPELIIQRAIDRVDENNSRIKSLESTLYSKMRVKIDGAIPGQGGLGESITETFSKIYDQRKPKRRKRVHILQRRQTSNIAASENLAVFDQFFDFTTPEVNLLKTKLVTPLAPDALDEYEYRLLGKKVLGDKYVYELEFEPQTRLYPGFEGKLTIVEGTYQVIAAEFSPTDETTFPFLTDLTYKQRYEQVGDSLWVPMYQEVTAVDRSPSLLAWPKSRQSFWQKPTLPMSRQTSNSR